jgi:hypothetical protein
MNKYKFWCNLLSLEKIELDSSQSGQTKQNRLYLELLRSGKKKDFSIEPGLILSKIWLCEFITKKQDGDQWKITKWTHVG